MRLFPTSWTTDFVKTNLTTFILEFHYFLDETKFLFSKCLSLEEIIVWSSSLEPGKLQNENLQGSK